MPVFDTLSKLFQQYLQKKTDQDKDACMFVLAIDFGNKAQYGNGKKKGTAERQDNFQCIAVLFCCIDSYKPTGKGTGKQKQIEIPGQDLRRFWRCEFNLKQVN